MSKKIVKVSDVQVLPGCMCGPHRCPHCKGKVAPKNNWMKGVFCGIGCARAYHDGLL